MTISRAGLRVAVGLLLIIGLLGTARSEPVKVRTIVDNAGIKAAPEIGAKSLIKLPLSTVLDVLDKQGEWYKVSLAKDGTTITGYIHEMLVEAAPEQPSAEAKPAEAGRPDPAAEIEGKIEEAREAIRQEKDLVQAEDRLDGLLAKVFSLPDPKKQKSLAIEIYLWTGISRLTRGDEAGGVGEFTKMFDVDPVAAKEATRNIAAPKVVALLKLAEQQSLGLATDFALEVDSEPPEARVLINGQDVGATPGTFHLTSPKFILELKKAGFAPVREEMYLTSTSAKRAFRLDFLKHALNLSSLPPGAMVSLDGKDTGLVTNCRLENLSYGPHEIRLTKSLYLEWTGSVTIGQDEPPPLQVMLVGRSYVPGGGWGGRSSGLLDKPVAMAPDRNGSLYVLDQSPDRVKKFTADGQPINDWKITAPEVRELKNPVALAVDASGTLYLADSRRNIILKVGRDGGAATHWTGESGGSSEFRAPSAVAFDSGGNIYVVDGGNNRIKKYSSRGEFRKVWGAEGTADGQFVQPRAIAVNSRDEILVLDKTRTQKFSAEGAFLASWGKAGRGEGQFQNPAGLAVDPSGCVYVADTDNQRIQKFDGSGRLLAVWGGRGREAGQFFGPVSVWAGGSGKVYVLERDNERVQIFVVGAAGSER